MTAPQNPRVTQADMDRAFATGIRLTKREWLEVYAAFARHREAAEAASEEELETRFWSIVDPNSVPSDMWEALNRMASAYRGWAASKAREAALVEALRNLIAACDEGRTVPRGGACGMTIEAQIRASVINGVPAWPVEEAREVLDRAALTKEPDASTASKEDDTESEPATVAQRITRAFAQHLAGKATVFHLSESAWASITFSGTRHVFSIEPLRGVSLADLTRAVEGWEPTIPERLLADAALSEQPYGLRATLLFLEDVA